MNAIASQMTGVSIVCSTIYSGGYQRKHQSSTSLAFVMGKPPVTGGYPTQKASNAENVSIWWRHQILGSIVCRVNQKFGYGSFRAAIELELKSKPKSRTIPYAYVLLPVIFGALYGNNVNVGTPLMIHNGCYVTSNKSRGNVYYYYLYAHFLCFVCEKIVEIFSREWGGISDKFVSPFPTTEHDKAQTACAILRKNSRYISEYIKPIFQQLSNIYILEYK